MNAVDFDRFLDRTYDKTTSNCFDLVADFYAHNLEVDLRKALPAFAQPGKYHGTKECFKRLQTPKALCICVFKPYNVRQEIAHVGIYWFGDIFHIEEDSGVRFTPLPLMLIQFASVRFYEYIRTNH